MDKGYFINAGISSWNELNCEADHSFFDSSQDKCSYMDSSLLPNEALAFRELIGKLSGGMGTPTSFPAAEASNFASTTTTNCSSLASPKLNFPMLDPVSFPNLGSSETLAPPLPSLASDPAFVERAAKFSCFGSRSFSGRSPPRLGLSSNGELGVRSNCNPFSEGNCKLSRVSSSPVLKQGGSASRNLGQMEIPKPGNMGSDKKLSKLSGSNANSSNEESISEQIPSGETGSKISNGMNYRKRKSVKTKEDGSSSAKVLEGGEKENAKRSKAAEGGKIEAKTEEEIKGGSNDEGEKQKANQKPPEPPKDYIHVRARRGQATDSHSLAERVRREKISERMKLLQDLVPGCNKVTGKALMLDEIINYVQSLQRQVEFLSMKLASVNPGLDFNMENLVSKDQMFRQNAITLPSRQMYSLDSSSSALYQQNVHHNHNNGNKISITPLSQCPVDSLPVDARNLGIHLPPVDGFNQTLPQFPAFSEDDLQSIVQMGFVNFPVSNPTPDMKDER